MKYYSEKLNKVYDTVEDLKAAEEAVNAKNLELQKAKEERAKAAKEVEDAYKVANEAKKAADDKFAAFLKKYGAYHKTYTNITTSPRGLFDIFLDTFAL